MLELGLDHEVVGLLTGNSSSQLVGVLLHLMKALQERTDGRKPVIMALVVGVDLLKNMPEAGLSLISQSLKAVRQGTMLTSFLLKALEKGLDLEHVLRQHT